MEGTAAALRIDLFPAEASFGFDDRTAYPARVVVSSAPDGDPSSEVLHIFADSEFGPARIYSAPVLSRSGSHREGVVATPDGEVSFRRASGCGCGSALKVFRPFPAAVHVGP
jgi:hypothetical protein